MTHPLLLVACQVFIEFASTEQDHPPSFKCSG